MIGKRYLVVVIAAAGLCIVSCNKTKQHPCNIRTKTTAVDSLRLVKAAQNRAKKDRICIAQHRDSVIMSLRDSITNSVSAMSSRWGGVYDYSEEATDSLKTESCNFSLKLTSHGLAKFFGSLHISNVSLKNTVSKNFSVSAYVANDVLYVHSYSGIPFTFKSSLSNVSVSCQSFSIIYYNGRFTAKIGDKYLSLKH